VTESISVGWGWWTVTRRGRAFTYHFYRDGSVLWTQSMKQPASSKHQSLQRSRDDPL